MSDSLALSTYQSIKSKKKERERKRKKFRKIPVMAENKGKRKQSEEGTNALISFLPRLARVYSVYTLICQMATQIRVWQVTHVTLLSGGCRTEVRGHCI